MDPTTAFCATWSRRAQFGPDGPCSTKNAAFRDGFLEASLAFINYNFIYSNTTMAFLFGQLDTSQTVLHAQIYHDRLVQAGSPMVTLDIITNGVHGAADTVQGADLLRDVLIAECIPPP